MFIATTDVSGCIKKVIYLSDGTSFPFLISISAIGPTLSMGYRNRADAVEIGRVVVVGIAIVVAIREVRRTRHGTLYG